MLNISVYFYIINLKKHQVISLLWVSKFSDHHVMFRDRQFLIWITVLFQSSQYLCSFFLMKTIICKEFLLWNVLSIFFYSLLFNLAYQFHFYLCHSSHLRPSLFCCYHNSLFLYIVYFLMLLMLENPDSLQQKCWQADPRWQRR